MTNLEQVSGGTSESGCGYGKEMRIVSSTGGSGDINTSGNLHLIEANTINCTDNRKRITSKETNTTHEKLTYHIGLV